MTLAKYRQMRDFAETSEPAGETEPPKAGASFVVQMHDASHLHYDFRLELGGVLLSWAVPKGPTLDPAVKRLAVQTEDHPVEYGGFEGTIPASAYGGGTVMVWDRGTWQAEGDAQAAYEKGHLKFELYGEKLHGGWHLVRTARGRERQKTWLLFKSQDEAARPGDSSIVDTETRSVLSGRSLDAIAESAGLPRANKKPAKRAKKAAKPSNEIAKLRPEPSAKVRNSSVEGAIEAPMPSVVEPELATLVSATPTQDDFVHEVKFDGYRVIARLEAGNVTLLTRNGEDWTGRMPELAEACRKLELDSAIFDGEFVALNEQGLSDFQLLQNSFSGKAEAPLAYYVFDLLYLNGSDLRPARLIDRKERLRELVAALPKSLSGMLRYSDHVVGNGENFFAEAAKLGLEGVVSKRAGSSYRSGRGKDWQKSKSLGRQEFVIVGYSEPAGSRAHLGALLLGVRKGKDLTYSGRVGTGFNERSLKDVHQRLTALEIEGRPELVNAPRGAEIRGVHWVEPKLVVEVAYTGVTQDGLLRHPIFKGLRDDKPARAVVFERPENEPQAPAQDGNAKPARAKARSAPARGAKAATRKDAATKAQPSSVPSAFSHPDKVLYPELGITKRELGEYYELVAELMLPHVAGRPITLLRCPEGRAKQCFFQKHPGESLGEGLTRVHVPASDGPSEYAAIVDARGLQSLVQMGALELHIWGALASDANRPDRLVFDLDPGPELGFREIISGALAMRDLLSEHGLKSWVKTTGGKGLHVTVPVDVEHDWDTAKDVCRALAEELAARDPERYLATMSKAKRSNKIFIDYFRNGRGATFVAPYSSRAREGAGIAMPVEWTDLTKKFQPDVFSVRSARDFLGKRPTDPFSSMLTHRQRLPVDLVKPTRKPRRA